MKINKNKTSRNKDEGSEDYDLGKVKLHRDRRSYHTWHKTTNPIKGASDFIVIMPREERCNCGYSDMAIAMIMR